MMGGRIYHRIVIWGGILLFIVLSCKSEKKEEHIILEESESTQAISIDSLALKTQGFCTQMSPYSTDKIAMFYEYLKDSSNNYDKTLLACEYCEWVENEEPLWRNDNKSNELSDWPGDSYQNKEDFLSIKAAIYGDLIWDYNELYVAFLNGNEVAQNKVMEYAKEWEQWCAVKFNFNSPTSSADIIISFEEEGYWSYIGSESKKYSPSMSLTGIEKENPDNFRGTVLHEFGHALGLIHEHQRPDIPFEWDEDEVVKYYREVHGWNREKTKKNIIRQYSFDQTNHNDLTVFDPESIMMYYIPKEFIKYGYESFERNNTLSRLDKKLIRDKYY